MIRFEPTPAPEGFEERVGVRGRRWLAANSDGRPPDHWREFTPALRNAFQGLCAYSAMYEPVGSVDHFVSCAEDRARAYDWTNYRFASAWINSSKQSLRSQDLLDPFQVMDGWFEIILPSLQLVATDRVPPEYRERAHRMLDRLCLGHDERVIRQRRVWLAMYDQGELTHAGLRRMAPLIAEAVLRRDAV
jgi:hypothetical protein